MMLSEIDNAECSIRSTSDTNVFIRTVKSKSRRRKRTKRITLKPLLTRTRNHPTLNNDIWELSKLNMEVSSLYELVDKRKDISVKTNAPTTFGLRKSFHTWRDSKLKEEYYSRLGDIMSAIRTTEESIRLWLSAIVMKKWSSRQEAMTYINDLETSIALHEFRLDSMEDEVQDLKELCDLLYTEASEIACMMLFNEAIVHEAYVQSQGEDESTTDDDESDEDEGFVGFDDHSHSHSRGRGQKMSPPRKGSGKHSERYDGFNSFNGKRLEVSNCLSQAQIQVWNSTFDSAWQSYQRRGEHEGVDELHTELSIKLKNTLICFEKSMKRVQQLKKVQKKVIIVIALANRTKNSLKQVSGYAHSTRVVHQKNKSDKVVNTDGRNFFVAHNSDSEGSGASDGGFQRGALNDNFASTRDQRETQKLMQDCEEQLRILANSEEEAKASLVKIIEIKLECQELNHNVGEDTSVPGSSSAGMSASSQTLNSVVAGVIWGASGVPALSITAEVANINSDDYVDLGNISNTLKLCRTPTKTVKVEYEFLQSSDVNDKNNQEIDPEDVATNQLVELLHLDDQKFGNKGNSIFIKELGDTELVTVLTSLKADKLYLNRKESIYFPEYFDFMRNFNIAEGDLDCQSDDDKIVHKQSSGSFSESLQRVSTLIGSLISNNESDSSSSDDEVSKNSSVIQTGFGLLFKQSTISSAQPSQFFFEGDTEESKMAVLGLADLLGVFVLENTYQSILGAISYRDYVNKDQGCNLPVVLFNKDTRSWIGLTLSLQEKVMFSFVKNCYRSVCVCQDKKMVCQTPSLPLCAPSNIRLDLDKYIDVPGQKSNATRNKFIDPSDTVSFPVDYIRFYGAWRCQRSDVLESVFKYSKKTPDAMWILLEVGILECAASHNAEAAASLVVAATESILRFPRDLIIRPDEKSSFKGGLRSKLIRKTDSNIEVVAPMEDIVSHVFGIVDGEYGDDNSSKRSLRAKRAARAKEIQRVGDLLPPLGAVRIITANVFRQNARRVNEACRGLAKWIDLSSSVAFRVLSSFYSPTIDSDSSSDSDASEVAVHGTDCTERLTSGDALDSIVGHFEASFHSLMNNKSRGHEPSAQDKKLLRKKRKRVSYYINKKTNNIDAMLHMRIPILGSEGVKVRAELYHDLLDLLIKTSCGLPSNLSLFFNTTEEATSSSTPSRQSIGLDSTESAVMTIGLCKLLIELRGNEHNASEVRCTFRFHLLQYILGLDERWTMDQSVEACRLVVECLETSSIASSNGNRGVGVLSPSVPKSSLSHRPISFNGRRSSILSDASFNILTSGLPSNILGATCSVRFSTSTSGSSILSLLDASETAPYRACLIVIKDSIGHVFGGFVNQRLQKGREYFGNGESFVFSVFPSTKLYPWSKRNDYFCYLTDSNIGMGGGGRGFSFLLDDELFQGSSGRSETFLNPILSFTEQFECADMELLVFE